MEHFVNFQFSTMAGTLAREETDWDDALLFASKYAREYRAVVHVHGLDFLNHHSHVMTVIPGECE